MKRQQRRRIKRSWDKIPSFSDCTDKVAIDDLSNMAVEVLLKVSDDLLLRYNLDMFQRWRLFPVVVVDGFFLQGLYFNVGLASKEWLDEYFGDNDEEFCL
jgi:glutaredoxin-related protein